MELKICSFLLISLLALRNVTAQTIGGGTTTSTSTSTSTGTGTSSSPPPAPAGGYDYPPPPVGGGPGSFPGGFGFPFFPGFYKNLDFSAGAGFGPFGGLGGGFPGLLGGLGGVPPPIDDVDFDGGPPFDGGFGGFPGFGGFSPSYIPSTWIGSALGAKGDLLFPIVIFVFFVVGVWTVIQLLLGFIVPLIAKKLAFKGALASPLKGGGLVFDRRDTNVIEGMNVSPDLDFITTSVMDAINEPKCLKYMSCHSGKFLNSLNGNQASVGNSYYQQILKTLSNMTKSEALNIFQDAFEKGDAMDCSQFTCEKATDPHHHSSNSTATAPEDTKANEVH